MGILSMSNSFIFSGSYNITPMNTYRSFKSILQIAALAVIAVSCTSNWPQFRGPDSNMHASTKTLPQEWGDQHNIQWEHTLSGNGWSCPIVWGDRVFLTAAILDENSVPPDTSSNPGRPRVNPAEGTYRWMLYCLDLESGELLWEQIAHEGKPGISTHNDNTYASETPVTDGKRVYAYFGMTGLFCYDFDGNLIWKKDLGTFETQSNLGTATSPVLYGKYLYIQVDNENESFLVAMDKNSGEEIWRVPREEKTNWSTPVIWKNKVRTELVTTGKKARSYDTKTGELIWELDLRGGRSIPSPVYSRDLLFTGNEKRRDGGGFLFAVKAGSRGDITPAEGDSTSSGVLWTRSNSGLSMPSPLLFNGYIYVFNRNGSISCIEETSGNWAYPNTRIPDATAIWASPWIYDNRIWCLDESGVTHVLKTGTEFEVLSKNYIEDKFWSSAAITDKGYIFRGVKSLYYVE